MKLTKEADLATDVLEIDPARAARLRREKRWPHVRLGRYDVRYTDQQIEQIVALMSRAAGKREVVSAQTSRSRKASA